MKEVKGYEEENKKIQHISNWSQKRREEKEWGRGNICRNNAENFPELIKKHDS